MKFLKYQNFSIISMVILILLININSTHVKTKAKRTESMMEYLNNFFSDSDGEIEYQPGISKSERSQRSYRSEQMYSYGNGFKFSETNVNIRQNDNKQTTSASSTSAQTNSTNSTSNNSSSDGDGMLQGWWEISSPAFKNIYKFPPVNLADGTQIVIRSDSYNFRLNSAYESSTGSSKPPGVRYFWFRLSGLHIYYTSTSSDINILGAISISDISDVKDFNGGETSEANILSCLSIDDDDHQKWKMCSNDKDQAKKWLCKIKQLLGKDTYGCDNDLNQYNTTIIEKKITQPIVIIPLPSRQCNDEWDYQQNGANWECDCSEGKEQAPIDLPLPSAAIDSPVRPLFQYDEVSFTSKDAATGGIKYPLKIKLDGNMLKIVYDRFGKLVTMDGAVYYAQEIQIHTPGEHTIHGKTYDMEIQIVHYGVSKGDISKQAILAFPIEKVPGVYNKFIDDLDFFNLPNPINKEKEILNNLFIPKILYNTDDDSQVIMKPFSFYTYQGSLTSPPCLENTIVYVASSPIQLGSTAIKLFQEALRVPDLINGQGDITISNFLPISNRKTQPLNGRPVFHYDHLKYCGPEPVRPKKPEGHYEKHVKPVTQYFYVTGQDPSGLPGALVVSQDEATGVTDPNKVDNKPNINSNTNAQPIQSGPTVASSIGPSSGDAAVNLPPGSNKDSLPPSNSRRFR